MALLYSRTASEAATSTACSNSKTFPGNICEDELISFGVALSPIVESFVLSDNDGNPSYN